MQWSCNLVKCQRWMWTFTLHYSCYKSLPEKPSTNKLPKICMFIDIQINNFSLFFLRKISGSIPGFTNTCFLSKFVFKSSGSCPLFGAVPSLFLKLCKFVCANSFCWAAQNLISFHLFIFFKILYLKYDLTLERVTL